MTASSSATLVVRGPLALVLGHAHNALPVGLLPVEFYLGGQAGLNRLALGEERNKLIGKRLEKLTAESEAVAEGQADQAAELKRLQDLQAGPVTGLLFAGSRKAQMQELTRSHWNAVIGRSYQVQYKTNLPQATWLNFGNPIVATNSTMTWSAPVGSEPQRFYRLQLGP